ncbi:OsmC family protein [Marinobacter changyiensis]|uniref:OsmC family protein n=1 Tax=Marinobacter changyiensis TaxID=2604091 RepID=UPI0012645E7D|nr:OsmC family protein [Marinobacter changyiensis]
MTTTTKNIDPRLVPTRQQPLQQRYRKDPDAAWIRDEARAVMAAGTDPFHGEIEPANNAGECWRFGIHRAVGGDHDGPNPGDLLAAALAACLHSTTRMIAQWLDIELADIEVAVGAECDVRGALMVDSSVPVGFQRMDCTVSLQLSTPTDENRLKALMKQAEACCVVMQTIRAGTDVKTLWHVEQETPPE